MKQPPSSRWPFGVAGVVVFCLLVLAGGYVGYRVGSPAPRQATVYPSVIEKVREVAVLESLSVRVHKRIEFAPDPRRATSLVGELAEWVRHSLKKPRGRAIVFGEARFVFDLRHLDVDSARAEDGEVWLVLPKPEVVLVLDPDSTEIIDSNLNSEQTAALFALAKTELENDLRQDLITNQRATRSAELAIADLLRRAGFRAVHVVPQLPVKTSNPG